MGSSGCESQPVQCKVKTFSSLLPKQCTSYTKLVDDFQSREKCGMWFLRSIQSARLLSHTRRERLSSIRQGDYICIGVP